MAPYDAEVTRLRQQTGCWGEIKWTKVAPRWLDVYRRFLALSLGLANLKFSAIAVDTTLFTTAAMRKFHAEGKREEAYLKFVRMLLRNHLERFAHADCHDFTILYDQMSVRRDLQRNFRGVLENDIANIFAGGWSTVSIHAPRAGEFSKQSIDASDRSGYRGDRRGAEPLPR